MQKHTVASCLIIAFWATNLASAGDSEPSKLRPVATYSIVARDPITGQLGVAVQSHWFSVGSVVTWARAGVGAVATQSFVLVDYGPKGLALMDAGTPASEALAQLIAGDDGQAVRQVAMVDVNGQVATHTGERCIPAAGHYVGDNFSVQANLMLSDEVWPRMAAAYENSNGDLADRMLAALEAAQAVGGDIRGQQSAAILIVSGEKQDQPWKGVLMELRVEDHPAPVAELRRLIKVHRAYEHMNAGDLAVEHGDNEGALKEYGAAEALFPDNLEMKFWHAVALVNMGRVKGSYPLFRTIFAQDENWRTLLPRLVDSELMEQKDVDTILRKVR
ncbi:MAG: DUF1028 domain-containing protein [Candidatus Marinimicrobia bacterium]|nr:DUF1028 domain-containing protein [Candidatus Neomarinimicrobiota bacterium]